MGTLARGSPVLERKAGTGQFLLRLGLEQSPGLTNWTALPGTVDFPLTPARSAVLPRPGPEAVTCAGR